MNRVDVTEIGRQDRQSRAWVIVVAISVKDGVDRKAVSKIVQSRPACRRTWLDTGPTNKPLERILHIRIEQPRARWREEQGRDVRRLARTIGAAEIGGKGGDRNGNSRDLPNFPLRIVSAPQMASKSLRSRPIASPTRMPVAVSKPINVR
jgi:hypothetical protein